MKVISTSAWTLGALLLLVDSVLILGLAADAAGSPSGEAVVGHTTHAVQTMPVSLRPVLYRALEKDAGAANAIGKDGCVSLRDHSLRACFDAEGAHFTGAGAPLALRLLAYGRQGETLSSVASVRPFITGARASYVHGWLTGWWQMLPMGFEQSFTITKRPRGQGELTLVLTASQKGEDASGTSAKRGKAVLAWGKLRYGDLVVTDANGKIIPAAMTSEGNRVLIDVNDMHAAYPLTVDPLVWLGQSDITAGNGGTGDEFGWSIAVDGPTTVIGAPYANDLQGAAYVFEKSGSAWVQTAELVGDTVGGVIPPEFGEAVAISGDTTIVCEPDITSDGEPDGAAYVFTESNGVWTRTDKITENDNNVFCTSVAMHGSTALIGSPSPSGGYEGKAYVFEKSGSDWTQTAEFDAHSGIYSEGFGTSVALDADGRVALIGAPEAGGGGGPFPVDYVGATFVFTESGGTWTEESAPLRAADGAFNDRFGSVMALASDGNTAFISAPNATTTGAVYVFTQSGGTWTQAAKLMPSDSSTSKFGWSISAALDGTTVFIGPYSSDDHIEAYVFTQSNGAWTQTAKFTGGTQDGYGFVTALEGTNVFIGAPMATVHGSVGQGVVHRYGESDLGLVVSAPQTVSQGQQYTSQTIATNNSSAASPAVSATITVPAAASFVAATASQGSCSETSEVVTCDFGPIPGNAGMATASVTLKATGSAGTTIENTASIAKATPPLTASAPTGITSPAACPAGYTKFSGHLDAGGTFASAPIEVMEAGEKYVDLTSPASFTFFAIVNTVYGQHTYIYPHVKHGHRWGAAGSYRVGVQAGPDAGGEYTLCVNLNPAQ